MAACSHCGSEVGWLSTGRLCDRCRPTVTPALASWQQALAHCVADRVLTPTEEQQLRHHQLALGLTDADVAESMPVLYRAKQLAEVLVGTLPVVAAPVVLRVGETAHFAAPSLLMEERTARRTVGGSRGTSVRLMKGVSFRVGASRAYSVPQAVLIPIGEGTFVITNKRCAFVGARTVLVALDKVVAFEGFTDGIGLDYAGKKKAQYFRLQDGELAAAVLSRMLNGA
ncbi:MAG: hypothetical protein WKG00_01790 [Polyangiaceae bacterium]